MFDLLKIILGFGMLKSKVRHELSWRFLIPSVILISTSLILTDTASVFLSTQLSLIKRIKVLFSYFCILFNCALPVLEQWGAGPLQEADREDNSNALV